MAGLVRLNACCGPRAERQSLFFSEAMAEVTISQSQHGNNTVPNVQVYDSVGNMVDVGVEVDQSTFDIKITQDAPFVAIYIAVN